MKSKFILDTSFISSFFNKADLNHTKAKKAYEALPDNLEFYLPTTVLLELTLFKIKFKEFRKIDFAKAFKKLRTSYINIDSGFIKGFNQFCLKTSYKLKTIDYTVLYTAVLKHAELLTFDQKLLKAYGRYKKQQK